MGLHGGALGIEKRLCRPTVDAVGRQAVKAAGPSLVLCQAHGALQPTFEPADVYQAQQPVKVGS